MTNEEVYKGFLDWASGVRVGINITGVLLQALVVKNVFTAEQALMMIEEMKNTVGTQNTTHDAQKTLIVSSLDQLGELIHRS